MCLDIAWKCISFRRWLSFDENGEEAAKSRSYSRDAPKANGAEIVTIGIACLIEQGLKVQYVRSDSVQVLWRGDSCKDEKRHPCLELESFGV